MDYEDIIDTLNNKLLRKVFSAKDIDDIITKEIGCKSALNDIAEEKIIEDMAIKYKYNNIILYIEVIYLDMLLDTKEKLFKVNDIYFTT